MTPLKKISGCAVVAALAITTAGAALAGDTGKKEQPATPAKADKADLSDAQIEALRTLHEANAEDFDKKYLKTQIHLHEDTLKLLDDELIPEASTPQVKSLLNDMRAHVQHHLAVAHSDLDTLSK
jgi:predicted outer membrane protein